MNHPLTPLQLKQQFDEGVNISAYLRNIIGSSENTDEIIECSYDLQSGEYIRALSEEGHLADLDRTRVYTKEITDAIGRHIQSPKSLLEVGAGECVSLAFVLKNMGNNIPKCIHGFDLCWSRLGYARTWLAENELSQVQLACASFSNIPYADNSFDLVLSSHSLEPNGGREREILTELHRISGNYLILCEPAYHLADAKGKKRMDDHGYIKDLAKHAKELGFKIVDRVEFKHSLNESNPTEALVIKKEANLIENPMYVCPVTKGTLVEYDDCFFSGENLCAYPKIMGIPCLRKKYSIIASKIGELS